MIRTSVRSLGAAVLAVVTMVSVTQSASAAASKKYVDQISSCTTLLKPSGSSGTAYVAMNGYGTAERKVTAAYLGAANVYGHVNDCARGFAQSASSIRVELRYTITFATVTKCEVGIPSGVTCTIDATGKTAIYKDVKTCKNTTGCSLSWPSAINVQSDDLDVVKLIQFKGFATATQSGKSGVSVSNYVNW